MSVSKLLFLGTGSSLGVPLLGCTCAVCTSIDKKNNRLRPSVLISHLGKRFIIDAGPDFRTQALRYGFASVDGFLFTHAHFDHIGGIEDIRALSFCSQKRVSCLFSKETLESVHKRCHYLFHPHPFFDVTLLPEDHGEIDFEGVCFTYVSYYQGQMKVNGFRIGDVAYVSDIRRFDEAILPYLQGAGILVLSAIHNEPSGAHFSFEEGIAFSRRVLAKSTYFTHLSHHVDHDLASRSLPKNFYVGYDGLEIFF